MQKHIYVWLVVVAHKRISYSVHSVLHSRQGIELLLNPLPRCFIFPPLFPLFEAYTLPLVFVLVSVRQLIRKICSSYYY